MCDQKGRAHGAQAAFDESGAVQHGEGGLPLDTKCLGEVAHIAFGNLFNNHGPQHTALQLRHFVDHSGKAQITGKQEVRPAFLTQDSEPIRAFLGQVLGLIDHQPDARMLQDRADFPPQRGDGAAPRPDTEAELVHDDLGNAEGTSFTGRDGHKPRIRV